MNIYLECEKKAQEITTPKKLSNTTDIKKSFYYLKTGASLVAQWLSIRLPMQGTRIRALVWEDPTYHGATKPVRHNY